jgi:protein-tyrosine-phosphatase
VLVLCHGNVCRSPLAGAVLARVLGAVRVRTAGVKPGARGPAAKKVREYAAARGHDLSAHRAREVTPDDYLWAGLVVYMDAGNRSRMSPHENPVCLATYAGCDRIPDPAFTPRGPKLTALLDLVVRAAEACGLRELRRAGLV